METKKTKKSVEASAASQKRQTSKKDRWRKKSLDESEVSTVGGSQGDPQPNTPSGLEKVPQKGTGGKETGKSWKLEE